MTTRERIAILKDQMASIEGKIVKLAYDVSVAGETSNLYWSKMRRKANRLYEEARRVFTEWSSTAMPIEAKKELSRQIREIKAIRFAPKRSIGVNEFVNSDIVKQIYGSIVNTAISDFEIGLETGKKTLNRLFGYTQQVYLEEKKIDKYIRDEIAETTSSYKVKKRLQKELLKKVGEGKTVTVVNKNGKEMQFGLKAYSEMVARTKINDIQTEGTVALCQAYGNDLIQVSAHNTLTAYDAQFEGRIYSLSGKDEDFPPVEDLPPFHTNCIHRISIYFKDAHKPEEIGKMSDYSKGITKKHPYRPSILPVDDMEGRKQRSLENE